MTVTSIHGICEPEFRSVHDKLQRNIVSGKELGARLTVVVNGQTVVDLWGGARDRAGTQPWQANTVVNLWSISKMVTNLAALLLVDRGLLNLDEPVARYWPEFAAGGKGGVLVRHVLSHSSGVAGWDPPFSRQQMYDTDYATDRLARQRPWWAPGSASGYHAQCQGHLIGELIRRITGSRLTEFVHAEIAGPRGADLCIGARDIDPDRIAELAAPPPTRLHRPPGFDPYVMIRTFSNPHVDARAAETADWRGAELGALNAHGNSRSVANILSVLAEGGDGLLSTRTVDLVFTPQHQGIDRVLGIPITWGLGYALSSPAISSLPPGKRCFWGGWGGSLAVIDPTNGVTAVYTMNRMGPEVIGGERSEEYMASVFNAVRSLRYTGRSVAR
ncbi:serine hydrolase domain-containing protein [Mycolicibacterium sp. XJ1819]